MAQQDVLRKLGDADALRGMFRVLKTGMQWRELDAAQASYATFHRRMSSWAAASVFRDAYRDTLRVYRKLCPATHYSIGRVTSETASARRCLVGITPTGAAKR